VEETLKGLEIALDTVVAAIRSALPNEHVGAVAAGEALADPATVKEPLTRLKKLLKNDDGEASDFIIDARPGLSKVLTDAEISTLTRLIGNFDFSGALNSLSGIAARLSLKLE